MEEVGLREKKDLSRSPCCVGKMRYLNPHLCDYGVRAPSFSKVGRAGRFNFKKIKLTLICVSCYR